MKIIFIPHLPTLYGRRYNLSKAMASQGHEVHFIVWDMPYPLSRRKLLQHLSSSWKRTTYIQDKLVIHKVRRLPLFWPIINGIWFRFQIRMLYRAYNMDMVITQGFTNETNCPRSLPFIYDINDDHMAFADIYGSKVYRLGYRLLGVRHVIRNQIRQAKHVTAVSEDLLKMASAYNTHVTKIPNGVEPAIFENTKKSKRPHSLIYVSTFGKWSRIIELIDLVDELKTELPNIHLDLVGTGTEVGKLKAHIKKLGLQKHITYHGEIKDRRKIFELISGAEVALNLSEKNAFRNAASPIKIFEYSALGKKIVSTDVNEVVALGWPNIFIYKDEAGRAGMKAAILNALTSVTDTKTAKKTRGRKLHLGHFGTKDAEYRGSHMKAFSYFVRHKRLAASSTLGIAIVVADILTLMHFRAVGFSDLIWLVLLLPVAGYLILSSWLDPSDFNFAEWTVYSIGVAAALLMVTGLVTNAIGLATHHPVFRSSVMLSLMNMLFALLLLFRYKIASRKATASLMPKFWPTNSRHGRLRILAPLLLPLLSVLGAIQLNNNGPGVVAISTLVLVFAYLVFVLFFAKEATDTEYTMGLFAVGLALTLSVSMRSNYLIGFDIHQEFQAFSAVVTNGLWQPHLFNNAYNACLSITVLPAMFKAVMPISSMYVFKAVMQLVLAILPVIVYLLARKRFIAQRKLAFVAALFFVVQGPYIFEFPALIRQQVALLFFGLIFLSATSHLLSNFAKRFLLITFGVAMVMSHYSTTYVTLALLVLLLAIKPLATVIQARFGSRRASVTQPAPEMVWYISPIIVIIVLLTAFLWYGETLQATGGILQKIGSSITNFSSLVNSDSHSDFVTSTFGISTYTYTSQTLQQIAQQKSVPNNYQPSANQYVPQPTQPVGPATDTSIKNYVFQTEHKIVPLLAGLILACGVVYLFLASLLGYRSIDDGVLVTAAGILFVLLAVLPNLSQDYNLERLYQQILILLAPVFVLGGTALMRRFFSKTVAGWCLSVIVLLYLLGTSGLLDQLVFGTSNINLANSGVNYDHYYLNLAGYTSLQWAEQNHDNQFVSLDRYASLDAMAYTNIPESKVKTGVLPQEVHQNAYLYANAINLKDGLAFDVSNNNVVTFNFPQSYFDSIKNTVYSNASSKVYK